VARWTKGKTVFDHTTILARMLDPRGGVRGEIRIFGENVFGFDIFLQLHQEAIAADENVQREIWLHLIELLDREEAFA
jgi:hypothetical protein